MKEKLKQSTSKICIEKIKQIAQQVRDDITCSCEGKSGCRNGKEIFSRHPELVSGSHGLENGS